MGKYLDYKGLSYLWDKIKLYLSSALSTKVDKVSSTDNSAVRFNGEQGAILNSGVIIDDNNNVTAAKFIKSNGTSSLFLKADGSVDSNSYLKTSDISDWAKASSKPTYNLDEVSDGSTRKLSTLAPKASPALTGTPTAPTAAASTNSTQIATTAFVTTAVSGKQDTISDLATIRSGAAAGATAYQKPSGGIPKTDLSSGVQSSLDKADAAVAKVTSTDNAVVRFDGTSGAVQNSGVTIDDSNNVTAAKFVTKNGTSSQFVKGDGSLDSTVYATKTSDDNKVPYGGVLMPTNSFGGKKVYINSMDNAFNAADQKYYVTITKHSKSANGITYPYVDSTKEATDDDYYVDGPIISTLTTWAHRLFSGDYETYLGCGADEYIKIRIMFGSNTSPSATTSYFSGYPYGNFYISYYSNLTPNIASQCRIYNKYSAQGVGWKLLTATAFTGTLNASSFIERVSDESDYRRTCVEFIIFGNDVSGRDVYITQIDYQLTRPTIGRDGSTVTKFDDQSLYFPFNWYNDHTKTVTINNNGNITAVKFIKSGGTSSQFLKADGSVDSNKYLTQSTFNSGNPDLKAIEELSGTAGLLKKTAANTWALDTSAYLTQTTFESRNPDLAAIEALTGTSGFLKKTAANTWSLDTNTYLTTSSASSTYLTQTNANSTYLKKTDASSTYLTQANAANVYLTKANASSTYAPKASPAFTGTPAAPTAATGTNTTLLATTAFVLQELSGIITDIEDNEKVIAAALTDLEDRKLNTSDLNLTLFNTSGSSVCLKTEDGTNVTNIVGTDTYEVNGNPNVYITGTQFWTYGVGNYCLLTADVIKNIYNELDTNKANLFSPAFTGTPTAPTATTKTNNTQLATTAFVQQEIDRGSKIIPLLENGSTTAGTWLAKTNEITSLVDGQLFYYKIAVAGGASTTTLNITNSAGTALGAKTIYRTGTNKLTTHYGTGTYLLLQYNTLNDCFRLFNEYDANSTTVYGYYDIYFRPYAAEDIYRYKLVALDNDGRLHPITLTNQTSDTQVAKTPTSAGLKPYKLWYYYTTTATSAGAVTPALVLASATHAVSPVYTFNTSIPAYKLTYLKGTYNSHLDLFYLYIDNSSPCTSFYVNVPTNTGNVNLSEYFTEGYYYWLVGGSYSSADYFTLFDENPLYYFNGTSLVPVEIGVNNKWYGTEDEFDALTNLDDNTDYYIYDE